MTQLFIDDQEVALPEDFTFELIRENPFFTKGGSFTLDISINLDIPVNAKLYKHINRFTSSSVFKKRSARLLVDGHIVLNGTEIILEVNELSASIQLASGNSELNYLIGSEEKISTLDLGFVTYPSEEEALATFHKTYPESNYVCAPVKAVNDNRACALNSLKGYRIMFYDIGTLPNIGLSVVLAPKEIRPMPYLLFYIKSILKALGYTIGINSLLETEYKRLFIVHGKKPVKWEELIGDKKVSEFLTEVEQLFNVVFVISKEDKQVDIFFMYQYYRDQATWFTPEIVEERFERKFLTPDEQIESHSNSNIRYDFPDNDYYKYEDIDPEILDVVPVVEVKNIMELNSIIATPQPEHLQNLYRDKETGTDFIVEETGQSTEEEPKTCLRRVNTFKRVKKKDSQTDIEIGIIPANICSQPAICSVYPFGEELSYVGYIPIPETNTYISEEENITVSERINGKQEEKKEVEKIQVAFWTGIRRIENIGFEGDPEGFPEFLDFPYSTTHYYAPWVTTKNFLIDETKATLSFNDPNGLVQNIYSKEMYDPEQEYIIHAILTTTVPSPLNIFIVNNQKFICKSLQFKITPDGFNPEYQATLYPMQ